MRDASHRLLSYETRAAYSAAVRIALQGYASRDIDGLNARKVLRIVAVCAARMFRLQPEARRWAEATRAEPVPA